MSEISRFNSVSARTARQAVDSNVNVALCKGCGTCVGACLAKAITGYHFTDEELIAQIEGIFEQLQNLFVQKEVTKSAIVEILRMYLPNFEHIETGKGLDSKM